MESLTSYFPFFIDRSQQLNTPIEFRVCLDKNSNISPSSNTYLDDVSFLMLFMQTMKISALQLSFACSQARFTFTFFLSYFGEIQKIQFENSFIVIDMILIIISELGRFSILEPE